MLSIFFFIVFGYSVINKRSQCTAACLYIRQCESNLAFCFVIFIGIFSRLIFLRTSMRVFHVSLSMDVIRFYLKTTTFLCVSTSVLILTFPFLEITSHFFPIFTESQFEIYVPACVPFVRLGLHHKIFSFSNLLSIIFLLCLILSHQLEQCILYLSQPVFLSLFKHKYV